MKPLVLPVALIAIAAASSAYAETTSPSVDTEYRLSDNLWVSVMGIRSFADNDRGVNNDVGYSLGFGINLNDYFSAEAKLGSQEIHSNNIGSKAQYDVGFDIRFYPGGDLGASPFYSSAPFNPFVVGGGGRIETDIPGGGSASYRTIRFGFGSDFWITDNFGLRAQIVASSVDDSGSVPGGFDVDMQPVPGEDGFRDHEVGIGVLYSFGETNYPAELVTFDVGLIDESESDDAVIVCAGAGEEVINFTNDSFLLDTIATNKLDNVAEMLLCNSDAKVQLVGHTDSNHNAAYNVTLSMNRALAAVVYLKVQGVRSDLLIQQASGESSPIDDNNTEAGRASNRRVTITWGK